MKIKIGIAEDNENLVKSLLENLSDYPEIDVVFTAYNGENALEKLEKINQESLPEVILMDIEMPVMNGIEATAKITAKYTGIKIIMLTVFDQEDKIFDSILAGASGYLLKDEPVSKIIEGIKESYNGGAAMSPAVAAKSLLLLRQGGIKPVSDSENNLLSKREMEILEQIANGLSYTQIADMCFISPGTVRKHIENIYEKLHVHTKLEAVQMASRNNWFGPKLSGKFI
jgi:DNA-binding NarL/FixJ family response regulator